MVNKLSKSILEAGEILKKLAPLLIILSGTFWGSIGIFVRILNSYGIESMQIVEIRAVSAFIIIGIIILIYDKSLLKINLRHIWCFVGTGIVGIIFFNLCYFATIEASSLSVAAVLMYTAPIFVMLLSAPLFKEKITKLKIVSLLLAFVGCVFVSGAITDSGLLSPKGILIGVLAGIGYALYTVFTRYALNYGYNPLTIQFYTFLCGAIAGLFLVDFGQIQVAIQNSPMVIIGTGVLTGLLVTAIPNVLYSTGLKYIDNGKASVMASVEPVMATIFGIIVFNEIPTMLGFVGIVLVISALILLNLKNLKKTKI